MQNSKAQIIATIGPASKDKETIIQMAQHQMDVARLNFSWGTHNEHLSYIENIREAAKELGKKIPIIQDLSGPRIQKEKGHEFDESSGSIITEKDIEDLKFGCEQKIDYVAQSFVGEGDDISQLRDEMKKINCQLPIIAKIERKKALDNLDGIIEQADAIMIARGDLGNEVPVEQIPFIQRTIITKAKSAKKPVITATEMLLSMTENSRPTRAEVSDVAHAILDGSDGVMLSEETASGKYPVDAVAMMEKIMLEAEGHLSAKEINLL